MSFSLPKINQVKLSLDDFIINRDENDNIQLGKGSFADVYKACHKKLQKHFAIKVVL